MHVTRQLSTTVQERVSKRKRRGFKEFPIVPMITSKSRSVAVGQPVPRSRQILATLQIGLSQKEEVVKFALFQAVCVALVVAKLVVAQAFEGFTLATGLLKDFLLFIPQALQSQELAFDDLLLLVKLSMAREIEAKFGRGRPRI